MIYFCADDYGISEKSNNRIEECVKNGVLNKISVLPNGEIPDLKERFKDMPVTLSLHLNLIEGIPLSNTNEIDLLVDKNGCFKNEFTRLLLLSLSSKRKRLKRQLYTEIKNQILFFKNAIGEDQKLFIDTHQHTHMIPLVFETLLEVIKNEDITVEYLRFPAEPTAPYLLNPSLYTSYSISGLIKHWLLKFFGAINLKKLKESSIKTALFMGVLFSGNLTEKRVRKTLPKYIKIAQKTEQDIEVLFHPGYLEWGETVSIPSRKGFHKFYFSASRKNEYNALINLK